ncbi:MAG TPA: POTRA domain-containing protein [Pricia sp.]|nr:POTRA domain-containing protein [Pricia sp.]
MDFGINKRTKTAFLEKLVGLKPGMALDSVLMNEDMTRLKRLLLELRDKTNCSTFFGP